MNYLLFLLFHLSRLTAIPLVQRGVYKYLRGTCKGQEYEVNSIRKVSAVHM